MLFYHAECATCPDAVNFLTCHASRMPATDIFRSARIEHPFSLTFQKRRLTRMKPGRRFDSEEVQRRSLAVRDLNGRAQPTPPTSGWEYALGFEPGELGSLVGM